MKSIFLPSEMAVYNDAKGSAREREREEGERKLNIK